MGGFVILGPTPLSIYKYLQSSIIGRPFLFAGHLERTRFRLHFLTRDLAPLLLSDEDSFMAVGFGVWGFRLGGGNCSKHFWKLGCLKDILYT